MPDTSDWYRKVEQRLTQESVQKLVQRRVQGLVQRRVLTSQRQRSEQRVEQLPGTSDWYRQLILELAQELVHKLVQGLVLGLVQRSHYLAEEEGIALGRSDPPVVVLIDAWVPLGATVVQAQQGALQSNFRHLPRQFGSRSTFW